MRNPFLLAKDKLWHFFKAKNEKIEGYERKIKKLKILKNGAQIVDKTPC